MRNKHRGFRFLVGKINRAHDAWDRNSTGLRGVVLYAVMGIAAALLINSVFGAILGTTFPVVTVSSTSMVPNLNVGDLVVVKGGASYELGDIIIFRGWEQKPIIHRVVAKYENSAVTKREGWEELTTHDIEQKAAAIGASVAYITRGDANPSCDQCGGGRPAIRQEDVHGRALLRVPYLGYVKLFAVRYVWNPLTG